MVKVLINISEELEVRIIKLEEGDILRRGSINIIKQVMFCNKRRNMCILPFSSPSPVRDLLSWAD